MNIGSLLCRLGIHDDEEIRVKNNWPKKVKAWGDSLFPDRYSHDKCKRCGREEVDDSSPCDGYD
jgi:hypothetical protein